MEHRVFCLFAIVALIVGSFSSAQGETAPTAEECNVEPHKRQNCGFPGVTPEECNNNGCCFDSTVPDTPWCFHIEHPEDDCL
ncbi:putative gastrointestinal growth factor xP1 [Pseudophryne corroboree]|uniref:putative gastrointestinal growth factor xP1 n=1 Tax=Pseudophryne corroboree TaxID=495146 RepID=UPI0030814653